LAQPQQPYAAGQQCGYGVYQPPASDLEKAKGDLDRAGKELAKFKADLDRMLMEYELKTAQLKAAMDAIKDLEKKAAALRAPADPATKPIPAYQPVVPGMAMPGMAPMPGYANQFHGMEQRMANMEKKLDSVLRELQELRKQFGKKGGGGAGGPVAPGSGAPPAGNFVPDQPGGPGLPPGPGGGGAPPPGAEPRFGPGGPAAPGALANPGAPK